MKAVALKNFPLGPSFSQLSRKRRVCWKWCPSEQSQSGTWQTGSCSITPSMVLQDSGHHSHESCWHPSRKADVCPITDWCFCSWRPPMPSAAPYCFRDCCRERRVVYPVQNGNDAVLHLLTRNGVWRRNYRDQAHSLKLRTVATAEICRDSACNAVWCAPHIKNKQKIPWLKKIPYFVHCLNHLENINYARYVPWLLRVISGIWNSKTSSPCPCLWYFAQQWANTSWTLSLLINTHHALSCPGQSVLILLIVE